MNDLAVQIININGLSYTRSLMLDLFHQDHPYKLRLVDQGSTEEGTKEFFETLKSIHPQFEMVTNNENVPLSVLWNNFYKESSARYLCFLSNDVRISSNFVKDTVEILNKEPKVGCVIHSTNHPTYQMVTNLNYAVLSDRFIQGWDFTIRREAYKIVPTELKFFGVDDFVFIHMYKAGWRTAIALSSPVIHINGASRQYYPGDRNEKLKQLLRTSWYERLPYRNPYSKWYPTFKTIIERGML